MLRKFKFNFTVFKEYCCSRYVTGEDKDAAKTKLFTALLKENWDKPIKKKDIVLDSFEEIIVKKGKRR